MNYSTEIDRKWQKRWNELDIAKFDETRIDQKLYVLEMFSYPSGANLHVGHWYNYGLSDSWARMKKCKAMKFFNRWALMLLAYRQRIMLLKQVFIRKTVQNLILLRWKNN